MRLGWHKARRVLGLLGLLGLRRHETRWMLGLLRLLRLCWHEARRLWCTIRSLSWLLAPLRLSWRLSGWLRRVPGLSRLLWLGARSRLAVPSWCRCCLALRVPRLGGLRRLPVLLLCWLPLLRCFPLLFFLLGCHKVD